MKKKPSKSKAKKNLSRKKDASLLNSLPKNQGEWLQLCIKLTKRAITNPPLESEKYLLDQIKRLESELETWNKESKT